MERRNNISLKVMLEIVIRKWWLVLFLTIFGAMGAYFISAFFVPPVYEAKTVMYNGNEKSSTVNSQQVIDYKQIALTHLVIDEVLKNTGQQISYEDFEKSVVVETLQDSSLFTVGFRSTNPETARKISDELARQLTLAVHNIVGSESLQILDQAQLPDKPISPTKMQNAIIGGLLGCLLALAICLAGYLFNDTIRDETDIEMLVEAPVLGSIPKYRGGDS